MQQQQQQQQQHRAAHSSTGQLQYREAQHHSSSTTHSSCHSNRHAPMQHTARGSTWAAAAVGVVTSRSPLWAGTPLHPMPGSTAASNSSSSSSPAWGNPQLPMQAPLPQ
jgi:hypothetical protein